MIRPLQWTLLAAFVFLAGCNGSDSRHKPEAAGGQGEVLVVMSKAHWETAAGATVRSILEQSISGLPQREPRFKVAQTTPENFGTLLAVHHSVLMATIDPDTDTASVSRTRDRHANGQMMVHVAATDPATWIEVMQRHAAEVNTVFEDHQRERIGKRLAKEQDAQIKSTLRTEYGIVLDVPGGYRVVEQTPDFCWLQRDRLMSGSGLEHNVIEGVMIHQEPYVSDNTFSIPYLVDRRDSVTREHMEGPNPGSYMIVQRSFEDMDLMPQGRAIRINDRFAYLMHGLYGMHGARMGGPFVSLSTLDEARARVITVEGFVYAPQFDKREYMRELEALLFSLRVEP